MSKSGSFGSTKVRSALHIVSDGWSLARNIKIPSSQNLWPMGFGAKLLTCAQRGVLFDKVSGLPEPMLRDHASKSWYEHICEYTDMKWRGLAPKSRQSVADALTAVTPVLLSTTRGVPDKNLLRKALDQWVLVPPRRAKEDPDEDIASVVRWLKRSTVSLSALKDPSQGPGLVRAALDASRITARRQARGGQHHQSSPCRVLQRIGVRNRDRGARRKSHRSRALESSEGSRHYRPAHRRQRSPGPAPAIPLVSWRPDLKG